ncbi:MAG TPA: PIG-L family deacetylase [Herpetosiphonaceae bacterium]
MPALDLDGLRSRPRHIYLSPHFDDAVLSCGGAIAARAAAGEPVLVVTICSAEPSGELTAFARHLHAQWGDEQQPIATRRREDRRAVERLGAEVIWLDALDAIYRQPAYDSVEAIFGAPVADDPLYGKLDRAIALLATRFKDAAWHAPLAVGNHVDHQITYQIASNAAALQRSLRFYEDLPYAARPGAVDARLAVLGGTWTREEIDIGATLEPKLAAVADYASQIKELFGDEAQMRAALAGHAAASAPDGAAHGERTYRRARP